MLGSDGQQNLYEVYSYHASSTLKVSRFPVSQNNILSKKSTIFLPSSINLLKVIEATVENSINVFMLTLSKLLRHSMGRKENLVSIVFKQGPRMEYTGIHKLQKYTRIHKIFSYKC